MRIFIADDSPYVLELLTEMLSEVPGMEVVGQTKDALQATSMIRSLNPDAVILDIGLVRGSGLGVLGTIKKEYPSMLVIILSGYALGDYRDMCLKLGADYFFEKAGGFDKVVDVFRALAAKDGGATQT